MSNTNYPEYFPNVKKMNEQEFGNPNHNATIWQWLPNMERWVLIRTYSLWYAQCEITGENILTLTKNNNIRIEYGCKTQHKSGNFYGIFPMNYSPNSMSYVC